MVIFGSQVNTKIILIIFAFFTFVISPVGTGYTISSMHLRTLQSAYQNIRFELFLTVKAIGRSNTGYVVAVVLLSFLRQIYIIYSIAKLSKSMRMPLPKSH